MKRAFVLLLLILAAPRLRAQERGAAALGELVEGMGTTGRVLMIGAHPDDEDTQLIAWLAKARHVETAYLSLTRGDGGQNLIGNELGPQLGMIRTEELLAARRIDGGRQYFTRAYDFGFVKTLDETMQRWPRDSILKDMVEIVRAFRPHVIISVWTGTPADGHGQHQYAGVLAREVFDAAADSVRFPAASVGGLQPWVTPKFYLGGYRTQRTLSFDVGEFDPLLGVSYSELATVSRSQHRSQGQGAVPERGVRMDGVRLANSRLSDAKAPEHGLFDGIDTSWARFRTLSLADSVRSAVDSLAVADAAVRGAMRLADPSPTVAPLASYVRLASRAMSGVRCTTLDTTSSKQPACAGAMGDFALALASTRQRAIGALLNAAGVSVDATAPRELVAEGDTLPVTVSVYDDGPFPVALERVSLLGQSGGASASGRLAAAHGVMRDTLIYRAGQTPTVSWWLRSPRSGDTFVQPMSEMIVGEDRLQSSGAEITLRIAGVSVPVRTGPIAYRFADPARGELRRPIATVPEISVQLEHEIEYARPNLPFDRMFVVSLRSAATGPRDVEVSLRLPPGLRADSAADRVALSPFGDARVYFRVHGRLAPGRNVIAARASVGEHEFTVGYVPIEYEHIRPLRYYRPSNVALEAVNAAFANLKIGYVRGVGDNVLPMLEELGLPVTELDPARLPQVNLSEFTTVVLGPRAYEASPALVANNPVLMRFVRDGGTIVTQYGQYAYAQPGILPYPITLARPADRVTDETAPMRVLDPSSPLLAAPNRIVESDFANWVQERSLYMPRTFDPRYHALFSMNDPGEQPNDGAVLVASVGKGTYVYTTLSFFRQLPAGNPGAARLFINLLSARRSAASRPAARSSPVRP